MKSYTYLIGWTDLDQYYYGVRWANYKNPEDDLWKEYFTSSRIVAETVKKHGDPDIIEIDQIFENKTKAIAYEDKYLREVHKSGHWDKFLNQKFGNAFILTEEMISKANQKRKQYKWSNDRIEHMRSIMTGREITEEWRSKIRKSLTGKNLSNERKQKISKSRQGQRPTSQTKSKISRSLKGRSFSKSHRELLSKNNARTDKASRKFIHHNGDTFIGTAKEFTDTHNLCRAAVSHIISGKQKTTKGWTYVRKD